MSANAGNYTSDGDWTDGNHRTYNSSDVREYPANARKEEVELIRMDDIEYDSGTLRHSSERMIVKLMKQPESEAIKTSGDAFDQYRPKRNTGEQPTYDDSIHANKFSSEDYYSLDLQYCYQSGERARRDIVPSVDDDFIESTLASYINHSKWYALTVINHCTLIMTSLIVFSWSRSAEDEIASQENFLRSKGSYRAASVPWGFQTW